MNGCVLRKFAYKNDSERTSELQAMPALSARQLQMLSGRRVPEQEIAAGFVCNTTVASVPFEDPAAGPLRA
jgi:hypothetical protein